MTRALALLMGIHVLTNLSAVIVVPGRVNPAEATESTVVMLVLLKHPANQTKLWAVIEWSYFDKKQHTYPTYHPYIICQSLYCTL